MATLTPRLRLFVVVLALACLPLHASSAPALPDQPDHLKTVFNKAGFNFHGEMESFTARSRPAKTEYGVIVSGLMRNKPGRYEYLEGIKTLWRVDDKEVDHVTKPNRGPAASGAISTSSTGWAGSRARRRPRPPLTTKQTNTLTCARWTTNSGT